MEILNLMYSHPFTTFFFLLGISWIVGSFRPFKRDNDSNPHECERCSE